MSIDVSTEGPCSRLHADLFVRPHNETSQPILSKQQQCVKKNVFVVSFTCWTGEQKWSGVMTDGKRKWRIAPLIHIFQRRALIQGTVRALYCGGSYIDGVVCEDTWEIQLMRRMLYSRVITWNNNFIFPWRQRSATEPVWGESSMINRSLYLHVAAISSDKKQSVYRLCLYNGLLHNTISTPRSVYQPVNTEITRNRNSSVWAGLAMLALKWFLCHFMNVHGDADLLGTACYCTGRWQPWFESTISLLKK